jgi:hypothetical protein
MTTTRQPSESFPRAGELLCGLYKVVGGVSWVNEVHVAGFGLASVGCAKDNDSLRGLVHRRKGREGGGRNDWAGELIRR